MGWGRTTGREWRSRKGIEDVAKGDQVAGEEQVGIAEGAEVDSMV